MSTEKGTAAWREKITMKTVETLMEDKILNIKMDLSRDFSSSSSKNSIIMASTEDNVSYRIERRRWV